MIFQAHNAYRLFDAFYTTKADGTGLGLPISQNIIQQHNGQLHAQSNGPDQGSTFSIRLPLE